MKCEIIGSKFSVLFLLVFLFVENEGKLSESSSENQTSDNPPENRFSQKIIPTPLQFNSQYSIEMYLSFIAIPRVRFSCIRKKLTQTYEWSGPIERVIARSAGGPIEFKVNAGAGPAMLLADELKITLEKYLFGMCPQSYRMPLGNKLKNVTAVTCDIDEDQQDLAGRLAALALRAHSASRSDCSRIGVALANTFGELARTSANRQADKAANKKRKLSKSQKAKIQAKQRTALAVKKKAAAAAAAAAAKMAS